MSQVSSQVIKKHRRINTASEKIDFSSMTSSPKDPKKSWSLSDFEIAKKIGRGKFSEVFLARFSSTKVQRKEKWIYCGPKSTSKRVYREKQASKSIGKRSFYTIHTESQEYFELLWKF